MAKNKIKNEDFHCQTPSVTLVRVLVLSKLLVKWKERRSLPFSKCMIVDKFEKKCKECHANYTGNESRKKRK